LWLVLQTTVAINGDNFPFVFILSLYNTNQPKEKGQSTKRTRTFLVAKLYVGVSFSNPWFQASTQLSWDKHIERLFVCKTFATHRSFFRRGFCSHWAFLVVDVRELNIPNSNREQQWFLQIVNIWLRLYTFGLSNIRNNSKNFLGLTLNVENKLRDMHNWNVNCFLCFKIRNEIKSSNADIGH
jgi:hypothetical protein